MVTVYSYEVPLCRIDTGCDNSISEQECGSSSVTVDDYCEIGDDDQCLCF
jgi:hypothetical protein